jgi:hypothetical protein
MKRSIGGRASGRTKTRRSSGACGRAARARASPRSSPPRSAASGSSRPASSASSPSSGSRLLTMTRTPAATSSRVQASTVCWAPGSRSSSTPPRITSGSIASGPRMDGVRSGAARQLRSMWRRRSSSTAGHQRSSASAADSPCHGPVRPSMQIDARVALPQISIGIGTFTRERGPPGPHRPSTRSCSSVHTPIRAVPTSHSPGLSSWTCPSSHVQSSAPAPASSASAASSSSGSGPRRSSRHSSCHATA